MAPEVIKQKRNKDPELGYDTKCDIFSIGIISYILLSHKNQQPFWFNDIDKKDGIKMIETKLKAL